MPAAYTRRLSELKAREVAASLNRVRNHARSPWVVAADTVVVLDEEVLEKPTDEAEAEAMLARLSGRWHQVISSFTVVRAGDVECARTRTVEAGVRFRVLSEEEIALYVATGEPMDKAGAYGIQGVGSFLVREVRGSYFAVVGLPVCEFVETLVDVGAVRVFPFVGQGEEW
jgi:septum formation protein